MKHERRGEAADHDTLRVAVDVTPLLGVRTGVGAVAAGIHACLARQPGVSVRPFAVTWRGRNESPARHLPMPARVLRAAWVRADHPVIERWLGPIDVVHGTNFVVPPSKSGAEVVSVHDLTFLHYPELCTPDTLQYPELIRRAVRRGALIHTDSEFVANEVREWLNIAASRVRSIRPGVPTKNVVARNEKKHPDRRPVSVEGPYVLALGTIEPRKDIPTLVRAFAGLAGDRPDLSLVIAGPPGWGSDAVDTVVAALPPDVQRRLLCTGWVDDDTRASLLAGASVFAYPSVYEGFGFPPLEAMEAGTPVVATTVGSLPEVLGDAALLVAPGDPDALAQAIERAMGPDGDTMRERGTRHVVRFGWDHYGPALVDLYNTALELR